MNKSKPHSVRMLPPMPMTKPPPLPCDDESVTLMQEQVASTRIDLHNNRGEPQRSQQQVVKRHVRQRPRVLASRAASIRSFFKAHDLIYMVESGGPVVRSTRLAELGIKCVINIEEGLGASASPEATGGGQVSKTATEEGPDSPVEEHHFFLSLCNPRDCCQGLGPAVELLHDRVARRGRRCLLQAHDANLCALVYLARQVVLVGETVDDAIAELRSRRPDFKLDFAHTLALRQFQEDEKHRRDYQQSHLGMFYSSKNSHHGNSLVQMLQRNWFSVALGLIAVVTAIRLLQVFRSR